jgi:hypothetical protein
LFAALLGIAPAFQGLEPPAKLGRGSIQRPGRGRASVSQAVAAPTVVPAAIWGGYLEEKTTK